MKKIRSLIVFFAFLIITNTVQATDYYISPTGNDSNTGSLNSPLKSFSIAQEKVVAGDNIIFRSGVYPYIVVSKSGSASAPITIKTHANETVIIDANNKDEDGIAIRQCSHVIIQGFKVKNSKSGWGAGIHGVKSNNIHIKNNEVYSNRGTNTSGIMIEDGSNNTIESNLVYDNFYRGIWIINHQSVTPNGIKNNIVINNIAHHNNGDPGNSDGIGCTGENNSQNIIANNESYANGDDGIDTWTCYNNTVKNNIAHHNILGDGNGFKLGGIKPGGKNEVVGNISHNNKNSGFDSNGSGNYYYNNTSYNNGSYGYEDGWKQDYCNSTNCNTSLINNIGYNNAKGNLSANNMTTISHNNIWYTDNSGPKVLFNYKSYSTLSEFANKSEKNLDNPANGALSSYSINPQFVQPSAANFSLTPTSPAIDKGDASNPGNINKNGLPDIGAIEYNDSNVILSPTPTSMPIPTITPIYPYGDLNHDFHVNLHDYSMLVANYGNPYTIFDYNNVVANYEK